MSYSLYIYKKTFVKKDNLSIPNVDFFNTDEHSHVVVAETIFDFWGWDFSERAMSIIEDEDRAEIVPSEVIALYEAWCELRGTEPDQNIISKLEASKMGYDDGCCFFEYYQSY